jgi:hypothetical protein
MKQVIINIPDDKYSFFLELVKNLGLEKVIEEPADNSRVIKEKKTTGNRTLEESFT